MRFKSARAGGSPLFLRTSKPNGARCTSAPRLAAFWHNMDFACTDQLHLALARPYRNLTNSATIPHEAQNSECSKADFEKEVVPSISSQIQLVCTMANEAQLSQSRTWTSPEFQIVKDFNRMRDKMRHLGFENSPFLPTTPGELVGLRAEILKHKARRITSGLREKERIAELRKNGYLPEEEPRLFGGKRMTDGLSMILSLNLIWNELEFAERTTKGDNPRDLKDSSWPTLAEYKE